MAQDSEQIQELALPNLDNTSSTTKDSAGFERLMNTPATESRLQQVLGINPKIWIDLKNKAVIPHTGTYAEFLQPLFNYYRKKNGVAEARARAALSQSGAASSEDDISQMAKLSAAEKVQKIRLDKAREQEIHLKNLATRGNLLDKEELYQLISPLIGTIANVLRAEADETPELQPAIDKCFNTLYQVGVRLLEQASEDSEHYVQHMLDKPINLDEILASQEAEDA